MQQFHGNPVVETISSHQIRFNEKIAIFSQRGVRVMVGYKTIDEMTVDEREAILLAVADTLEVSAREAILEGQKVFAENSQNIALAIRGSADELATEDLEE